MSRPRLLLSPMRRLCQGSIPTYQSKTSSPINTSSIRPLLTLQPRERMQGLFAAGQGEDTEAFKDTYRHRAGIEGTHSQGTRTMGLRRSRYVGLPKTHLGHVTIATAINVVQLMRWLRGEAPEQTRTS